jgi:hypothetical protein
LATVSPISIYRVRRNGKVDQLGEWLPSTKELFLEHPGFPLTPPGRHQIDGDLPWVFDEMAPDGFIAGEFVRFYPELQLPPRRHLWSADNVVKVISNRGADLSGNLIVGTESLKRLYGNAHIEPLEPYSRALKALQSQRVDELPRLGDISAIGGERPKVVLRMPGGTGLIRKFTPSLITPSGARWSDLLRCEAHAAVTLNAGAIPAVRSRYFEDEGRGYLEIDRFDRFTDWGRAGHVTLFNLGATLYGEVNDPIPVIAGLVRDGHLPQEDEERFRRIHSFSKAIANDDTHLGNYGLLIDDDGKARLAPAYDVLPMAFAPKRDELPDRLVKHTGPRDAATDELVQRLMAAVEADAGISPGFKEAWLHVVA